MKQFKAIAAMSENRVIGHAGKIPWHLPEDFKWFKKITMGDILIMGRKTYESIGQPLPGRDTYILSRRPLQIAGTHSLTNIEALNHLDTDKTLWIAGGAEIYQLMLPLCQAIFLSRVHRTCQGDTFFPHFENDFRLAETIFTGKDFDVEHWVRRSSACAKGDDPEN